MNDQNFFDSATVRVEGDTVICEEWIIPENLFYFKGHFPGMPVLPAVAIVDISIALFRAGWPQRNWDFSKVDSAKFTQPLPPGLKVKLVGTVRDSGECDFGWWIPNAQGSLETAAQLTLTITNN